MGTFVRIAVIYLLAPIGVATAHLEGQSRPSNLTATAGPTPPPGQPTTMAPVLTLTAPTPVTTGRYRVVAAQLSASYALYLQVERI